MSVRRLPRAHLHLAGRARSKKRWRALRRRRLCLDDAGRCRQVGIGDATRAHCPPLWRDAAAPAILSRLRRDARLRWPAPRTMPASRLRPMPDATRRRRRRQNELYRHRPMSLHDRARMRCIVCPVYLPLAHHRDAAIAPGFSIASIYLRDADVSVRLPIHFLRARPSLRCLGFDMKRPVD